MNEQDAMNRMAEGYCDGLALNDVEDPARYRQAAEQGGLLALHDEMSAATNAERGPSRRLLDSVVTRLRMGWGDLFDRAGIIREDHQGRPICNPPRRSFARGWCRSPGTPTSCVAVGAGCWGARLRGAPSNPARSRSTKHAGGASRRCGAAHC